MGHTSANSLKNRFAFSKPVNLGNIYA